MRLMTYLLWMASLALSCAWGFSPFYDVTRLDPFWWLADSGTAAVLGFFGLAVSMSAMMAFALRTPTNRPR